MLYKLSREALYPPYVELKASGVREETLEKNTVSWWKANWTILGDIYF